MKKSENVQLMSTGQALELGTVLLKAIPREMPAEIAQGWIGNPKALEKALRSVLMPPTKKVKPIFPPTMVEWQEFYKKHFNMECDFSQIRIPEKPEGNWRLLIIANVSLEQLYAQCKGLFSCWRWTDNNLDKRVTWNERDAKNGAYAIWVKDAQEADEELKNLSANDIKAKGITTETLAERLIHEIEFFEKTGDHLDKNNITLCTGSRYGDGDVPRVGWGGGKVDVDWDDPGHADDYLCSRQAVS